MTVQLTEGWWKTAWPSDTKPKCFDAVKLAIKNAKVTKRGLSPTDYLAQLHSLEKFIPILQAEAKKQFKTTPLSKRKADKMLGDFEKFIAKSKAGVKMDAKPKVVYTCSFADALRDKVVKGNKEMLSGLPKMEVKLQLMAWLIDELEDKSATNQLHKAIDREFEASVKKTAAFIDKYAEKNPLLSKSHMSVIHDEITGNISDLNKVLQRVPAEVLRRIGLSAKVAKQYKIDQGIGVAVSAAGTAAALGGLAVPGTPALAAAAACRACIGLAKEIAAVSMTLDKKISVFESYLEALQKMFSKAHKAGNEMNRKETMKELTLSSLNTILGIDALPTMRKANDGLKSIEGHIAVLDDRTNRLAGKINDIIDAQARLKKAMYDATSAEIYDKNFIKLKGAEKSLNKMLKIAAGVATEVRKAEDQIVVIRRKMKELNQPGTKLKAAQVGVDVLISAGTTIGAYIDAIEVGKEFKSIAAAYAGYYTEAGDRLNSLR